MSTKVSTDLIDLSGNTGGLVWAKGPTTDQPASATAGEMRVDTTTNTVKVHNGTQWKTLKETAFVVPPVPTHFLVIAGGGGGGSYTGGGGGAGGLRTSYGSTTGGGGSAESTTGISLNTAYTITIGEGGAGGPPNAHGNKGINSLFSTITSEGGGYGGGIGSTEGPAGDGGSGGGAGIGTPSAPSPLPGGNAQTSPVQGYNGGAGGTYASPYPGGGGGGAGVIGANAYASGGGDGGNGLSSSITGSSVIYAGGGGGSGSHSGGTPGSGGTGGGGAGGDQAAGENATFNTGSGGGGGGVNNVGGSGGSGVVILRYPTADLPYFTTTGTLNTPSATDTVADVAYPVTNLAYYKLDSDALDSSGNGYNGTASNITYGAGKFGNAGEFNGSSSYISIPTLGGSFYDSDFSISLWVNLNSLGGGSTAYLFSGAGSRDVFINFNTSNSGGGISARLYDGTIRDVVYSSAVAGNWYHVVFVRSKTSGLNLYVDGVSRDTNTFTGNAQSLSFISDGIGGRVQDRNTTDGKIDQVRIFSSALAPGDVQDLYNEHFQTKFTDGSDTALKFTGGTGDITFADTAPVFTPGDNFNTVLYTGNGSTQAITGTGFTPDLIWTKNRSSVQNHYLFDSVRGDFKAIYSDLTNAEFSSTNYISFDSDGFTTGSTQNQNNNNYVAWSWKAGGAARNNTDGSIASLVSANVDAGFSIVKYSGNSTTASVGHGLSIAPELILFKCTNVATDWLALTTTIDGSADYLTLNSTSAKNDLTNGWLPDSTTINFGSSSNLVNLTGRNYIAYCFHSVTGYSKIGSYTGNGSATGPIITLGFEPAWIMIKRTNGTGAWSMFDNKRDPSNPVQKVLQAQTNAAEANVGDACNFNSNDFQLTDTNSQRNANGGTYIYMAFATNPT
jgi:hypothetical protein